MSRADPFRVADYLQHILEAIGNIQDYTAGMDLEAFMADRKTRDAVIRNLEVIGEACNNIAKNHLAFASRHAAVPWSFAYEMRNALSHGYFIVDHGIVWQTIQQARSAKSQSADFCFALRAMHSESMFLAQA